MENTDQGLQLSDYVAAMKRRRHLLVLIGLPIVLCGVVLATALPDVYQSSAVVSIELAKVGGFLSKLDGADQGENYADQYVYSVTDRVLNSASLKKLVRDNKLYPEYADDIDSAVDEVKTGAQVEMVTTTIIDPDSGRQREVITGFTLAFSSDNPQTAKNVATVLSNAFLEADRDNRQQRAAESAKFFAAEADRFRNQITALEERMAQFKAANYARLPELADVNMNAMDRVEREVDNNQMQIRTLQQQRIFLVQQLETARRSGPDEGTLRGLEDEFRRKSTTYDQNHPDLVSLRRQIESLRLGGTIATGNSLQAQLDTQRAILLQARQRYSEDHPDVQRLKRDIAALEARVRAGEKVAPLTENSMSVVQLQTQLNAMDTQITALTQQNQQLRSKMTEVEDRLVSTPQVEREYQRITRDLTLARQKFEQLLERQLNAEVTQAAIASGSADEFHLMQAPSVPSGPAAPARSKIIVVALILALALGASAAVVAEVVDPSVRGSRDLRSVLNVTPLAIVPEIRNSVSQRRHRMRLASLAASVVIGVPLLYLAVAMFA